MCSTLLGSTSNIPRLRHNATFSRVDLLHSPGERGYVLLGYLLVWRQVHGHCVGVSKTACWLLLHEGHWIVQVMAAFRMCRPGIHVPVQIMDHAMWDASPPLAARLIATPWAVSITIVVWHIAIHV